MFTYKNSRVYVAGISFQIPNNCILDLMNTETTMSGFVIFTPNRKIKLNVIPRQYIRGLRNSSAYEHFDGIVSLFKDEYTFHTSIEEVHKYGMNGYSLMYSIHNNHYLDERYDLPEAKYGLYALDINIYSKDEYTIEKALKHPMLVDFFKSIQCVNN